MPKVVCVKFHIDLHIDLEIKEMFRIFLALVLQNCQILIN